MPSFFAQPTCDPDILAKELIRWVALAQSAPPAWDGDEISIPIGGSGGIIGRLLPGKGVYLDHDLRRISPIRQIIPGVFERSRTQRAIDFFKDNRRAVACAAMTALCGIPDNVSPAAIAAYNDILTQRAAGKYKDFAVSKTSITTAANFWYSLYAAGGNPTVGTYTNINPGAIHTRASVGAWSGGLQNPASGEKTFLISFGWAQGSQSNWAIIADLLWAGGNVVVNAGGAQTVNSSALTRYTGGKGVMVTAVVTTALGGDTGNVNVSSYTDQDGNTGNSAPTTGMAASTPVHRLAPGIGPWMNLASGDYGVRAIASFTAYDSGSAGVMAVQMYFPLMFLPGIITNSYVEADLYLGTTGMVELTQASNVLGCLTGFIYPTSTSSALHQYFFRTVSG